MPWVRIDENAIDHPKFLALSDGAWRLWCEGQCYCQKHLTDGLINAAALRRFRNYSPAKVKNLTDVLVTGKGPCWHRLTNGDIQVHDYLDWNDSAEEVMNARDHARERKRRYNDKNGARNAVPDAERTTNVSSGVCSSEVLQVKERGLGETDVKVRAGAFVEWYQDTHERLFHIGYMGSNKDWQKVLELCERFTDQQLRDGALVWFGMDDDFARNGTRSIPKFASRITGCLQEARARGIA